MIMNILKDYERYLKLSRKSSATIYQYLNDVKLFSKIAGRDFSACNKETLDLFLEVLIDRKYENSSIARKIASMKCFYSFLMSKGVVKENPFFYAPKLKIAKKDLRVLSSEEVSKVTNVLYGYPETLEGRETFCIFHVMYFLGLRVSEVAGLDVSSITSSPEKHLRFLGKGGKERLLPIVNEKLICSLDEWLEFRYRFPDVEALFISRNIQRISVKTIQRWIKKLGRNSGLGDALTPHVLRRTFATHLLEKGADIFSVSDLLGHESIATTRRYAKVTPKKRKETLILL